MEENHQQLTPVFSSSIVPNNEIRIAMSSTKENIRKLYEASKIGSIQILKTLLQEDPHLLQKVSISTSNIESPLHVSISHGHLEFTRLLLDHNPELASEVDTFQRTPLHLATANGSLEIIRALLEKNTTSCLVRDQKGLTPLHYAVINDQIEIMQKLIDARPQSVWMKLNNGRTILHLCVEANHLEAIKLLTETIANGDNKDFLNTTDDSGNTMFDVSLMPRQIEMVRYLLSIPEVRTGTSTRKDFAASNGTKESSEPQESRGRWKVMRKNLKYKGDWVQEVQGTMMLVATVIATVTFQAGVNNPPGGVWQQDTQFNCSSHMDDDLSYRSWMLYYDLPCFNISRSFIFPAGTAIMKVQKPSDYWFYLWMNTISFLASLSVILLITSGFPLKNKICSWLLALTMCVAVVSLGLGYFVGVKLINSMSVVSDKFSVSYPYYASAFSFTIFSWFLVVGVVGLWHVIRFLVWMVKSLFHTFTSKLKSYSFNRTIATTP